jgi:hypothetical protein
MMLRHETRVPLQRPDQFLPALVAVIGGFDGTVSGCALLLAQRGTNLVGSMAPGGEAGGWWAGTREVTPRVPESTSPGQQRPGPGVPYFATRTRSGVREHALLLRSVRRDQIHQRW